MRQVCVYAGMCARMLWVASVRRLGPATPQTLCGWKEGRLELGDSLRLQSPESMPGLGTLD